MPTLKLIFFGIIKFAITIFSLIFIAITAKKIMGNDSIGYFYSLLIPIIMATWWVYVSLSRRIAAVSYSAFLGFAILYFGGFAYGPEDGLSSNTATGVRIAAIVASAGACIALLEHFRKKHRQNAA
jgi:hypothetical protein